MKRRAFHMGERRRAGAQRQRNKVRELMVKALQSASGDLRHRIEAQIAKLDEADAEQAEREKNEARNEWLRNERDTRDLHADLAKMRTRDLPRDLKLDNQR